MFSAAWANLGSLTAAPRNFSGIQSRHLVRNRTRGAVTGSPPLLVSLN